MQAAYTNLLMKREESVIAANLERRQIGEQFKLLDSASLPGAPFNDRQRLTVLCSGAAAGLLLGLIAVFLLEYHDSSFRAEEEVMAALSIPVLALIPLIQSDHERLRQRRRTLAADVAGICVLASAAAIVVIWRLQS
jgi:capsular polysaccharide biosynthesis protein